MSGKKAKLQRKLLDKLAEIHDLENETKYAVAKNTERLQLVNGKFQTVNKTTVKVSSNSKRSFMKSLKEDLKTTGSVRQRIIQLDQIVEELGYEIK